MIVCSQEQESGDGTNFCVSFGGELLQRAEELLKEGIHANDVYKGYELARDKASNFFGKKLRDFGVLDYAL